MNIITNTTNYSVGGMGRFLQGFAQHLNSLNNDKHSITGIIVISSSVALTPDTIFIEQNFKQITTHAEIPRLPDILKDDLLIDTIRNTYAPLISLYKKFIEQECPDLVLVNGTGVLAWCLYQAAKECHKKIVLHYHGSLTQEMAFVSNPVIKQAYVQIEQSLDDDETTYIFPSKICKDLVEATVFQHSIKRSFILPNPIQDCYFQKKQPKVKSGYGFVGRWDYIKNTTFIATFIHWLNSNHPDKKLYIVSNKKTPSLTESQKKQVVFMDPMPPEELATFFAERECIICPSIFETYGNVPQEAIASGTPALVTPTMGVAETFAKIGASDWITEFRDAETTKRTIDAAIKEGVSPSMRKNLLKECSPELIYNKYVNILNESI